MKDKANEELRLLLPLLKPTKPYNRKEITRKKNSIWSVTILLVVGIVAAFDGDAQGSSVHHRQRNMQVEEQGSSVHHRKRILVDRGNSMEYNLRRKIQSNSMEYNLRRKVQENSHGQGNSAQRQKKEFHLEQVFME